MWRIALCGHTMTQTRFTPSTVIVMISWVINYDVTYVCCELIPVQRTYSPAAYIS